MFEILTINGQMFRQFLYFLFLKRISQLFKSIINFIKTDFSTLKKERIKEIWFYAKRKKKIITHNHQSIQSGNERCQHQKVLEVIK